MSEAYRSIEQRPSILATFDRLIYALRIMGESPTREHQQFISDVALEYGAKIAGSSPLEHPVVTTAVRSLAETSPRLAHQAITYIGYGGIVFSKRNKVVGRLS